MTSTRESLTRALWAIATGYAPQDFDKLEPDEMVHRETLWENNRRWFQEYLHCQGLAIVPIEPTEEMLNALNDQLGHGDNELIPAYKAMLKASEET